MTERKITIAGEEFALTFEKKANEFAIRNGELETTIVVEAVRGDEAVILVDGVRHYVPFALDGDSLHFHFNGEARVATIESATSGRKSRAREHSMSAPMPGSVLKIFVEKGDVVAKGTPLIVLEAMKMEHQLSAPNAGRVAAIHCRVGELVQPGLDLIDIEPEDPE